MNMLENDRLHRAYGVGSGDGHDAGHPPCQGRRMKIEEAAVTAMSGGNVLQKVSNRSICIIMKPNTLAVGDIVLVSRHGNNCLHLVKAVDRDRLKIGNNRGSING